MSGDQTQSSEGGTGKTNLGPQTTTHTRRLKAPLGSLEAQCKGTSTGAALQRAVLYIQYGQLGLQEGRHRQKPCVAKCVIGRATRAERQGYTDLCFLGRDRPRPSGSRTQHTDHHI